MKFDEIFCGFRIGCRARYDRCLIIFCSFKRIRLLTHRRLIFSHRIVINFKVAAAHSTRKCVCQTYIIFFPSLKHIQKVNTVNLLPSMDYCSVRKLLLLRY